MVHPYFKGLLKTTNALAYLIFLVSNIYSVDFPKITHEIIKQTHFTPATWIFSVWPIIHIALLCPIIYSFVSDRGNAVVIDGISLVFPVFMVIYAIFATVRAEHNQTCAFILSFCLNCIGLRICTTLKMGYPPKSIGERFFIIFPFCVCQAYNTVVFSSTAFEEFGIGAAERGNGSWTTFSVVSTL